MTIASLGTALEVLAIAFVVIGILSVAVGALLVRRLRRPLLLFRGVTVPLRWRWSLARQAVLHRRLMVAVGQVRVALPAGGGEPWQGLALDLESLATGVDRELVEADRRPRPLRQRALPELERRVREVEQVAGRLVAGASSFEAGTTGRSAAEIMQRLQAVEGALAELQAPPDPPSDAG